MAFPKGQLEASFKHTLCMLLFFAPGEGVAECEALSELLIIIFHLHSLWLSLSRSLLSGTFFFLFFFFVLKALPHRNMGVRVLTEWGTSAWPWPWGWKPCWMGEISEPRPPHTSLSDLLIQSH